MHHNYHAVYMYSKCVLWQVYKNLCIGITSVDYWDCFFTENRVGWGGGGGLFQVVRECSLVGIPEHFEVTCSLCHQGRKI